MLGQKSLAKLILYQFAQDPDNGYKLFGKQDTCSILFRLILELYRYIFATKKTIIVFITKLKHESLVYRYLDKIQEEFILVYLRSSFFSYLYFLDFGVRIIQILLML
jgi:hypothetical protein